MGMLMDMVAKVMGRQPAQQPQQENLLSAVTALLNHPQVGGVSGLTQLFESQGLGHLMKAWVANGPNPPVSGGQLQQVLGSERMTELAQKLGINPNDAANQLAAILPHAIDHLTPNGAAPQPGSMTAQSMLDALKSKFMHA